ncbi:hypothetical protein ACEF14_06130 [Weissella paramesenteroides]|uniref:hypothetical protein n=1 Tax=Weissella paramesenteroides TaxID=1249 RepID=UPI0039828E81
MDKLNEIAVIVGIISTVSAWPIFKSIHSWWGKHQHNKSEQMVKVVTDANKPFIDAYEREHTAVITEIEKIKAGELASLHDRVYQEGRRLLKQGWASMDDIDNFIHMYQPYRDLGGNGTGEAMGRRVMDLPVKEGTNTLVQEADRIHKEREAQN